MTPFTRILRAFVLLCFFTWICGFVWDSMAADEEESLWSFQPVHSVSVPENTSLNQTQSPVDAFILQRLEERGLTLAPLADRRTLLRRATFDLTGLPPTPGEINAFLSDESSDAFANVIDRLLASPQYGERWGRHWLDVVRYADARDLIQLPAESDFREAWRYRDWVVQAFNRDLPYDQFIRLQVAGDLLQPADKNQIDVDALIATGMLSIADFVPGDVDKTQMIADYVNDQIDVVGRAILGLTLACARCHDHKFDPISTEDYYAMAGIFFSSRLIPGPVKGNTPLVRVPLLPAPEIAVIEAGQARDKIRAVELSREINTFGEREYRAYLERTVATETNRYLLGAWEFVHPPEGQPRSKADEFARHRTLDPVTFRRWIEYFDGQYPHPALLEIRGMTDKETAQRSANQLSGKLSQLVANMREPGAAPEMAKTLAQSSIIKFRADDRRVTTNDARQVTCWPNRGRRLENAVPVANVSVPTQATTTMNGRERTVLHFSGEDSLQTVGTVPAIGSLFAVYRPDPAGSPGQRLVGWEDAAVGQHGLGIMTDGKGAIHAILRRNGANGDVVVPAATPAANLAGFQILAITWGPGGVAAYRNGEPVGNNKGIDSVSIDPAISALMVGGAGSGPSSRFQGDLAELRVYDIPLEDQARTRIENELRNHWFATIEDIQKSDPIEDLYEELVSALSPFHLAPGERDKVLPIDFRQRLASLRGELEAIQKKPPVEIPRAVVIQDGGPAETPHAGFHDAHIYIRGNHTNLGKTVPRGVPKSIAGHNPPTIPEGSGRKELANWLVHPDNPLTPRVMVNRIWQHHFGTGLVPTSANFGAMGDRPSHPELLDYLASRFIQSGWSVKSMHRLIMISTVYQQTSVSNPTGMAIDPENKLLWRSNRRRLEAEAFRDSLFAVTGRLDLTSQGSGFQDVAIPRRSLYLMSTRTGAKTAEFGPLFDAPDCSGIVERRNESIVAPQALFLMNDPLVAELAASLVQRIDSEVGTTNDRQRIQQLYEITLGRLPTEEEIQIGMTLLTASSQPNAWASYCRMIICTNEFMFVD
jgi:hypothetical protein